MLSNHRDVSLKYQSPVSSISDLVAERWMFFNRSLRADNMYWGLTTAVLEGLHQKEPLNIHCWPPFPTPRPQEGEGVFAASGHPRRRP